MRESEIEAYLVARVKALHGEVRKVAWVGHRGAPDRIVMLPERNGTQPFAYHQSAMTLWVELKAPGKEAEPHQAREHSRMAAMGQNVFVIDSIGAVDMLLGKP